MESIEKNKLRTLVGDRLVEIGFYMNSTLGFPIDVYVEQLKTLDSLGDQLLFINNFASRHKSIKPIYYHNFSTKLCTCNNCKK